MSHGGSGGADELKWRNLSVCVERCHSSGCGKIERKRDGRRRKKRKRRNIAEWCWYNQWLTAACAKMKPLNCFLFASLNKRIYELSSNSLIYTEIISPHRHWNMTDNSRAGSCSIVPSTWPNPNVWVVFKQWGWSVECQHCTAAKVFWRFVVCSKCRHKLLCFLSRNFTANVPQF